MPHCRGETAWRRSASSLWATNICHRHSLWTLPSPASSVETFSFLAARCLFRVFVFPDIPSPSPCRKGQGLVFQFAFLPLISFLWTPEEGLAVPQSCLRNKSPGAPGSLCRSSPLDLAGWTSENPAVLSQMGHGLPPLGLGIARWHRTLRFRSFWWWKDEMSWALEVRELEEKWTRVANKGRTRRLKLVSKFFLHWFKDCH